MLRAVSQLYLEGPALELYVSARRDVFRTFRSGAHSAAGSNSSSKKVLEAQSAEGTPPPAAVPSAPTLKPAPPLPPPPPSAGRTRRLAAAAAVALTASLGGVYLYNKYRSDENKVLKKSRVPVREPPPPPIPPSAKQFPAHVQYLIVGGGTAAFAALRAIRSTHPTAQVLVVSAERALPYMRPPLSKELWQERELATRAVLPDLLSFRQWNGKRRSITYEPESFYTPVEQLEGRAGPEGTGGVGVARGWRVVSLDVPARTARVQPAGEWTATAQGAGADQGADHFTLTYDKCLIATGSVPRRTAALAAAASSPEGAGRVLTLRSAADVAAVAAALERDGTRRVAVLGGGFLATELTHALADRVSDAGVGAGAGAGAGGTRVVQIFRERGAMSRVLPAYLAADVTRRLRALPAADVLTHTEVTGARMENGRVVLELRSTSPEAGAGAGGEKLAADLVIECVGAEPDTALAAPSKLELDPVQGGLLVNAELQARADLFVAGDVAAFYDETLGRRRVEHHDHAVVSGRLAGANMAAALSGLAPSPYRHQSMFWSDLGPDMGYEAIGLVDSRLPTVGVFNERDVSIGNAAAVRAAGGAGGGEEEVVEGVEERGARRYERGVVFYLREKRVVGVLLYNMFNRLHLARQVLAAGEFEDLLEVGKLFALPATPPTPPSPSTTG